MKKIISLLLIILLIISLGACGVSNNNSASNNSANLDSSEVDLNKSVELDVAMISDFADITDQSFNQTTYEACKEYCQTNNCKFEYYKPDSNSDDDRITAIENAVNDGHNVIVIPGYAFANAIKSTAEKYPNVYFVALDVSDFGDDYYKLPSNLYCAAYKEEISGYMAGVAAVKLGYKKIGFLGGKSVPAVIRYGYGFVQGIDAAAAELGLKDVECKYAYCDQYYGDSKITASMNSWYQGGTEIVFACGGSIYTSVAEAASQVGGKVIGVDTDQKSIIDDLYGKGITITSAMKGLATTVHTQLSTIASGKFQGGKIDILGIVDDNPKLNYVQLPIESTQFIDGKFSIDDYLQLVADLHAGTVKVDNSTDKSIKEFATMILIDEIDTIK